MESRAISQTGRATTLPSGWTADRKPQKQANPSGTNNIPNCHRCPPPPLTGKSQLMNTFELVNSRPTEHTPNISWGWFSGFVSCNVSPAPPAPVSSPARSLARLVHVFNFGVHQKEFALFAHRLGSVWHLLEFLLSPRQSGEVEGGRGRAWSVLEACNKFWLESFLWHRQEMPHINSATRFVSVCWFSFSVRLGSTWFSFIKVGCVGVWGAGGCFCGRFASLKAICRAEPKSELATRHAHWLCQLHEAVDGKGNEKDDELQE